LKTICIIIKRFNKECLRNLNFFYAWIIFINPSSLYFSIIFWIFIISKLFSNQLSLHLLFLILFIFNKSFFIVHIFIYYEIIRIFKWSLERMLISRYTIESLMRLIMRFEFWSKMVFIMFLKSSWNNILHISIIKNIIWFLFTCLNQESSILRKSQILSCSFYNLSLISKLIIIVKINWIELCLICSSEFMKLILRNHTLCIPGWESSCFTQRLNFIFVRNKGNICNFFRKYFVFIKWSKFLGRSKPFF